jgi:hypothetical protein
LAFFVSRSSSHMIRPLLLNRTDSSERRTGTEATGYLDFDEQSPHSGRDGCNLHVSYVSDARLDSAFSRTGGERAKSAFLVADLEITHHVKLHTIMTNHSPLKTL